MKLSILKRPEIWLVTAAIAFSVAIWSKSSTEVAVPVLPDAAADTATHLPFGPLKPPKSLPAVRLTMSDGRTSDLAAETSGHWTLLQLMFAGCTTTCPIQGAIFQQTQKAMREAGLKTDFLSVSIDPLSDDPAALSAWLKIFEAEPGWRAGSPAVADLGPLLDSLEGRGKGVDVHDARVYMIDPTGKLAYASEDLPDPAALVSLMREAPDS